MALDISGCKLRKTLRERYDRIDSQYVLTCLVNNCISDFSVDDFSKIWDHLLEIDQKRLCEAKEEYETYGLRMPASVCLKFAFGFRAFRDCPLLRSCFNALTCAICQEHFFSIAKMQEILNEFVSVKGKPKVTFYIQADVAKCEETLCTYQNAFLMLHETYLIYRKIAQKICLTPRTRIPLSAHLQSGRYVTRYEWLLMLKEFQRFLGENRFCVGSRKQNTLITQLNKEKLRVAHFRRSPLLLQDDVSDEDNENVSQEALDETPFSEYDQMLDLPSLPTQPLLTYNPRPPIEPKRHESPPSSPIPTLPTPLTPITTLPTSLIPISMLPIPISPTPLIPPSLESKRHESPPLLPTRLTPIISENYPITINHKLTQISKQIDQVVPEEMHMPQTRKRKARQETKPKSKIKTRKLSEDNQHEQPPISNRYRCIISTSLPTEIQDELMANPNLGYHFPFVQLTEADFMLSDKDLLEKVRFFKKDKNLVFFDKNC